MTRNEQLLANADVIADICKDLQNAADMLGLDKLHNKLEVIRMRNADSSIVLDTLMSWENQA